MDTDRESGGHRPPGGVGFLLAQVGAHAAAHFADGIAQLNLTPPQAGLLRLLVMQPGRSQRELADELGMPPSRFVPFADKLEERGLIERRRNPDDRRLHALHLTTAGRKLLGKLSVAARDNEDALCRALSPDERTQLTALLGRIAADQGLIPGVHPGYKSVNADGHGRPAQKPFDPR
ncbi:MarR family winged helix-turn-helix transcriptional regulator [Nocardia sp. NEAU-G5]|uniref:MarR family winged helix-turn-helix transcriptional regulator n=1 Tax=Nocardia albiluteola TaxID=2842303 RepID=A0ABS6AQY9_9NOCA|nr:MarR family winged helix-turn-helix transcriptional regulator [Nocardia albiluteola]MBU3060437.1 MarR family winged helix-turn-helix transcriptional regulator [Nocardia albiluteola]